MGVRHAVPQGKGHGPIAQVGRVRVRVLHASPPRLIDIPLPVVRPRAAHAEPGGPAGVQRDVPYPGELLVPPLQQQVGEVGRVGIRIGVPDEEAVELSGGRPVQPRQHQEDPCGEIVLHDVEALGEQQLQQPAAQLGGTGQLRQSHALALQIRLQDRVHLRLLLVDRRPALVHVVL